MKEKMDATKEKIPHVYPSSYDHFFDSLGQLRPNILSDAIEFIEPLVHEYKIAVGDTDPSGGIPILEEIRLWLSVYQTSSHMLPAVNTASDQSRVYPYNLPHSSFSPWYFFPAEFRRSQNGRDQFSDLLG